jgi:hypothetical protein
MPHIVAFRSKGQSKGDGISVVLSQDAVITGPDGDPWCGVTMDAEQARCMAQRLHSIATEIENEEEYGYRTSPLLLEHASNVVVLHDGSLQSHRACQAAMQYAHRSLGNLDLIGVFGIDARDGDIKVDTDDSDWQKGWLSRLADAYLEQAEASGVTFHSQFLPAHDPCAVLDLLYRMTFDLLVIPKRLSQFGIHGERLMPSIINRKNVNVLVCP